MGGVIRALSAISTVLAVSGFVLVAQTAYGRAPASWGRGGWRLIGYAFAPLAAVVLISPWPW